MEGEGIDQTDDGKNPQHLLLRRGQQQVTAGAPGVLAPARQRCHAAGINEFQAAQINDDLRLAGRDCPEPGCDARGICDVQLPTQGHDSDAFADTQIHADHGYAFLHEQQGGVLTQQLVHRPRPRHYTASTLSI
jgi:hypothetical protein